MINHQEIQEKEHIKIIRDSSKNEAIEYLFDVKKDLLATGGFGETYKVKKKCSNKTQSDQEYALKIFNKVNFEDYIISGFLKGKKIHSSLNHEHIVKYEHSFEDKKNIYLLTEFCDKGTLASLIKSRKFLEEY